MVNFILPKLWKDYLKFNDQVFPFCSAAFSKMATPHTANEEALKKVEDQLECSICLQPYTDPKLLPCFHVYCKDCLKQIVIQDQDGSTVVTCPKCRQQVNLPEEGVAALQSAFHISHLFDIRETLEKAKEPEKTQCEKCKDGKVTGFCRDCGKFVCESCTRVHQKWDELANHQIVGLADIQAETASLVSPKTKVLYCSKHAKKKLKIYCGTCQELICSHCTIRLHKDHQYDLVADTFPKHRDEIKSHTQSVIEKLDTVNKALQALDTRAKEIEDQRMVIEGDIHKRIDQLHQALDQRREELVGQLYQLTQQKLKNLATQKDQFQTVQTQLASCLKYVEGSLKTGTEGEILAMKAPVVKQIQQIAAEVNPDALHPCEVADALLVEDDGPKFAEPCRSFAAVTTPTVPTQCYATGDGLQAAVVGEKAEVTLHTMDKDRRETFLQPNDITAELVCCQNETKIKSGVKKAGMGKYRIEYQPTTRGKHQLSITIGGKHTKGSPHTAVVQPRLQALKKPVKVVSDLKHPWGVTTDGKGRVIVAESGAHCVTILTPDRAKLQSFGSKGSGDDQFNNPFGVAVDTEDNIYVVDSENHRIQKFTSNGRHIKTVGCKGSDPLQFNTPVGIALNTTNLYICDQLNHRIQVLTLNSDFARVFGEKGSGNGQFVNPCGVLLAEDGEVYVADRLNDRIQVFTPEGQFLRKFGDQGGGGGKLRKPSSITIGGNRVYVTERDNGRVVIFTTDGQFLHSFGTKGEEPGQFKSPWGITIDRNGFILVADRDNNRIQVF